MKLPGPRERLADCIWLPRIIAKARLFNAGLLPADYSEKFCHPGAVDSHFLGCFKLTKEQVLTAAEASHGDDAEIANWFTTLPTVTPERIAEWNHLAVNLGRPGFPMAERFVIGKATLYKHVATDATTTVFELLEADEKVSSRG